MKEVFLLTKVLFKNAINSNGNKSKKDNKVLKYIGWTLLYAYIIGIIAFFSYKMVTALAQINQEAVFLNYCLLAIIGLNLMRSLFSGLNLLFFSKDIEFLLPLPVKPYKIVMAKINCMLISEYIISAFMFLPALIVYGYVLKLNILFYIVGILVMLLIHQTLLSEKQEFSTNNQQLSARTSDYINPQYHHKGLPH